MELTNSGLVWWGEKDFFAVCRDIESQSKEGKELIPSVKTEVLALSRFSNLSFIATLKIENKKFIAIVNYDNNQLIPLE